MTKSRQMLSFDSLFTKMDDNSNYNFFFITLQYTCNLTHVSTPFLWPFIKFHKCHNCVIWHKIDGCNTSTHRQIQERLQLLDWKTCHNISRHQFIQFILFAFTCFESFELKVACIASNGCIYSISFGPCLEKVSEVMFLMPDAPNQYAIFSRSA